MPKASRSSNAMLAPCQPPHYLATLLVAACTACKRGGAGPLLCVQLRARTITFASSICLADRVRGSHFDYQTTMKTDPTLPTVRNKNTVPQPPGPRSLLLPRCVLLLLQTRCILNASVLRPQLPGCRPSVGLSSYSTTFSSTASARRDNSPSKASYQWRILSSRFLSLPLLTALLPACLTNIIPSATLRPSPLHHCRQSLPQTPPSATATASAVAIAILCGLTPPPPSPPSLPLPSSGVGPGGWSSQARRARRRQRLAATQPPQG